jgi:tetratricopeptide (TPR) repeat protein
MTNNAASTSKRAADGRASVSSDSRIEQAAQLAERAELIFGRYLSHSSSPSARVARQFRESGDLEIVLSLYAQAMADDPQESAYPWNLASSLDRLRLSDLALIFLRRAIRVAEEAGDDEWAGVDVHLAWADVAMRAGEPEMAEMAIEKARELDPGAPVERYVRQLRKRRSAPKDAGAARNDDAARKGTAVEYLIAASCMLASNFKLNVSTNMVDDEGVDLVFHRRDSSATLAVQVKSRSWSASVMRDREKFIADIRRGTFHRRRDLFLLFVAVDSRFAEYGPLWLIPSTDFADAVAPGNRTKLRFAASASPASNDRWVKYRMERSQLPDRILSVLDELELTAKPST